MKVLFHVSRYWPAIAGAALHTRKMIQYLEKKNHHINVIRHFSTEETTNEIAFAHSKNEQMIDGQTSIYQIGSQGKYQKILELTAKYHQQIRLIRPLFSYGVKQTLYSQFLHIARSFQVIHSVYTGLTPTVVTAQNVAKKLNIPFILTPLPHIENFDKPLAKSLLSLYQRSDALIAMTAFEKKWFISQGISAQKIHICPIGALISDSELFDFRAKYNLSDKPIVLFIGRQVAYKGYKYICQATEKIWQHQPDTHFIFIGPTTEESQAFFSEYQDKRILNLGKVSEAEKTSALSACNVLCVPSTEESLGAIYLEAWTYKKPVIAADIPAMHSVISHDKDGLIVNPHPEEISQSLLKLIISPNKAIQMGEQGYKKVQQEYNWDTLADKLANIYSRLL